MLDLHRGTLALGALLALVVLIAVGLTQLRDDDTPTIEKADLLAQGDEICGRARAAVEDQISAGQTDDGASRSDVAVVQQVIVPAVRQMFDDVADLGSPAGDRDLLEELYDRIDDLLDDVEANGLDNDRLTEQQAIVEELHEYGFEECGFAA